MIGILVATGRAINRAAFLIDAVANHAACDCTCRRAEKGSAEGVPTAAVVTDDATGERTEGATRDRTLLGVGPGADAAGQESAQR